MKVNILKQDCNLPDVKAGHNLSVFGLWFLTNQGLEKGKVLESRRGVSVEVISDSTLISGGYYAFVQLYRAESTDFCPASELRKDGVWYQATGDGIRIR